MSVESLLSLLIFFVFSIGQQGEGCPLHPPLPQAHNQVQRLGDSGDVWTTGEFPPKQAKNRGLAWFFCSFCMSHIASGGELTCIEIPTYRLTTRPTATTRTISSPFLIGHQLFRDPQLWWPQPPLHVPRRLPHLARVHAKHEAHFRKGVRHQHIRNQEH